MYKHTHMISRPNHHLTSCYCRLSIFWWEHIPFHCDVPLLLFLGGPIALQWFVPISAKSASVILQWSSTILTATNGIMEDFMGRKWDRMEDMRNL